MLKVLSWNVNSLKKRFVDVQQYALEHDIDVICLQETLVDESFNPRLSQYKRFILESKENVRGLIIYIKNSIPAEPTLANFGNNTETICLRVYLDNYVLNIVNIYIPKDQLNTNDFPDFIYEQPTLLVGDLNARHPSLGSEGNFCNRNGKRWFEYMHNCESVRMIGENEPTHAKGGRLDYICLFQDQYRQCSVEIIDTLYSDHYALLASLNVQQRQGTGGRKRLQLPVNEKPRFIKKMGIWYRPYVIKDSETFLEDMNNVVNMILNGTKKNSSKKRISTALNTNKDKNNRRTMNSNNNMNRPTTNDNSSVDDNVNDNTVLMGSNECLINSNNDIGNNNGNSVFMGSKGLINNNNGNSNNDNFVFMGSNEGLNNSNNDKGSNDNSGFMGSNDGLIHIDDNNGSSYNNDNSVFMGSNEGLTNSNNDNSSNDNNCRKHNARINNNSHKNNIGKRDKNLGMKSKRWFKNDKKVQYYNYLMKCASRNLRKDRSEVNQQLVYFMADKCRIVKQEAREKSWQDFVGNIHRETSQRVVWKHIDMARGVRRKTAAHKDPQGKADELMEEWASASAFRNLPERIREELQKNEDNREHCINEAVTLEDESCWEITEWELSNTINNGKSTAPGEDGITYDIIAALVMVEGNPLLKLLNMIYKNGKLPILWKKVIIIPIPKPGEPDKYRPISLTSCICKTLERILLNRLLYKIKDKLHPNLNGFIKGRNTASCLTTFTVNKSAKYSVFLDLKGAFDRANQHVILYELVKMGIKGKLLSLIKDYLIGRRASVWFQGKQSTIKELELGTPQGGVLSPTLFNVLMNVIVSVKKPSGVTIVAYADDILIQANTFKQMQNTLDIVGRVCDQLGFVISTRKTKAMSKVRNESKELILQNDRLEYVETYKYLGIHVGGTRSKEIETQSLITKCRTRLRPLKAMAYSNLGASVSVLRTMYIAYVRSVIDYAAPVLANYDKGRLNKLELIQNEAMRIILGCPKSTKVSNMRLELGLHSIMDRIKELNTVHGLRTLRDERNTLQKLELINIMGMDEHSGQSWAAVTARDLNYYNVVDIHCTPPLKHNLAPWNESNIEINIPRLPCRKSDMAITVMRANYLEVIATMSEDNSIIDQVYCDGSLCTITGRAGAAITIHNQWEGSQNCEKIARLHDWASSTQSELLAILIGLKTIEERRNNTLIISDSMAALHSLTSKNAVHATLVERIRKSIHRIKSYGVTVMFVWMPSHINISGNERADVLAKQASQKESIDYNLGLSIKQIKSIIKQKQSQVASIARREEQDLSRSIRWYNGIVSKTSFTYGRKHLSRHRETVHARIRLGYHYLWQFTNDILNCKVCNSPGGHTLSHYVMECPAIAEFRSTDCNSMLDQAIYLLQNDKINAILKRYNNFAAVR